MAPAAAEFLRALKGIPRVSWVAIKDSLRENFRANHRRQHRLDPEDLSGLRGRGGLWRRL